MIEICINEIMGIHSAMHGMRNPLNSWDKNDTVFQEWESENYNYFIKIGQNDKTLARKLIDAGPSHRKFMRQIFCFDGHQSPSILVERVRHL